jgi:hypothetical protein
MLGRSFFCSHLPFRRATRGAAAHLSASIVCPLLIGALSEKPSPFVLRSSGFSV